MDNEGRYFEKKGFKIVASELLESNSKSSENKAGYGISDFFLIKK